MGITARPCDVAIVGMACVMPGAPDLEAFWANIVDGVDSVTEVSPSRWDPERHFDPTYDPTGAPSGTQPRSVSKWGGWVPDVGFDALAWGIPPASLAHIDPAQLLTLKVAGEALEDAGYNAGTGPGTATREFDRDHTSLVVAVGSGGAVEGAANIALRVLLRSHGAGTLPAELDAFLPQLTADGLPGVLTSVIAGRIANRLDLGGKNLTVDSACASGLVALDICCSELLSGSSDMVLCGGVDLHNSAQDYLSFTAAGTLSPRGRCHSFDANADGMTLAEGAGCLVLKRLADAERDGDRIYAVVKGVAGSSDGRHLGLTAPRREGQVKAVRRTYARAGISPAEVGLLEAHGTGTAAGDRTELETMTETFGEAGAGHRSVVLGTVKSNIGHVKCAAGIASLIKAAKSAYHGVLPPTLHITEPNPAWDPQTSPFVFLDEARPWLEERRTVGISGFGFGGTNFHAVLDNHSSPSRPQRDHDEIEGPVQPSSGRPHWPTELFLFRAPTQAALDQRLTALSERLADELAGLRQADRWRLRDIAAAESTSGEGPVRLALVADSLGDLAVKVAHARQGTTGTGVYRASTKTGTEAGSDPDGPEVAFLFAEPGEARLGMGADVLVAFPHGRQTARAAGEWTEVMLPPQAFGDDREQQEAALAGAAERATATMSVTLARTLVALGVTPAHRIAPGQRTLPIPPTADEDPDDTRPVEERFVDDIRALADQGVRVFVQVGPGDGLARRVREALADLPHTAVATDTPGRHGLASLLDALAQLAVAGVPVDVEALHAGRGSLSSRWHDPGRTPGWIVNGHCARTASGDPMPKGLRPANQAPPVRLLGHDDPVLAGDGRNGSADHPVAAGEMAAVTEYLRLVHGIMATGSDVIRNELEAQS